MSATELVDLYKKIRFLEIHESKLESVKDFKSWQFSEYISPQNSLIRFMYSELK